MKSIVRCNWGTHHFIAEVGIVKNCAVEIGYRKDDPYTKWVVEFAGNGHYFQTARECWAYIWGRWPQFVKNRGEYNRDAERLEALVAKEDADA